MMMTTTTTTMILRLRLHAIIRGQSSHAALDKYLYLLTVLTCGQRVLTNGCITGRAPPSKKLPFVGEDPPDLTEYMVPSAHRVHTPRQHLDWFSHFSTASGYIHRPWNISNSTMSRRPHICRLIVKCCIAVHSVQKMSPIVTHVTGSTQPCIPPGSLNRVPASAGVRAGMSPLPAGR